MEDNVGSGEFNQTTIFNSGIAALQRLHSLLIDCNQFSRLCRENGNFNSNYLREWRSTLENIYREINSKLTNDETSIVQKNFNLYRKYVPLYISNKNKDGDVEYHMNYKNFNNYYSLCDFIEKKLRKYADKYGMLLPTDNSGDDWLKPKKNWTFVK